MTPMKKLAMLAVLTGMIWAGLGNGVPEAWAIQCGIGCPAGYHAEDYYCDVACGQCVNACNQATHCQPNDDYFFTCGSCPAGYQTSSPHCNFACLVCGGGGCWGLNNAAYCRKI